MEYSADSLDASVTEFYQYYEFLKTCIKRNVIVDKGIIVANAETYIRLAHESFDEYNSFYFSPDEYNYIDKKADNNIFHRVDLIEKKKYNGKIRFLAKTHLMFVYEALAEQFADFPAFEKHVKSLDAYGTVKLIQKAIYKSFKPQILNMSKSLVFILGNIDEAFHMNSALNPDNSADIFHKHTLRIGITEINKALQKRFRNEQISRLGNNHIIYPALSSEAYSKIIAAHIRDFRQRVEKSFRLNIEIDQSVNDIIFKEGVFPVMGARPLKTTFVNLIESYFTNIISDIITNSSDVDSLSWTYESDKALYLIKCFNSDAETVGMFSYPVQLKVESKRKPLRDDKQALVATHEAGHAIASMMTTRIVPVSITSTAVTDSQGGSCDTGVDDNIISFKMLKNRIVTSLGGYLAERLIFGDEMTTSGSETDIEHATGLAATAIISLAMGSEKANIGVENVNTQHTLFRTDKHEREISDLLSKCTSECESILERNKTLLIEMSNYLSDRPLMDSAKIKEFAIAYAGEQWARDDEFIKPKNYYDYREILKNKHAELEAS